MFLPERLFLRSKKTKSAGKSVLDGAEMAFRRFFPSVRMLQEKIYFKGIQWIVYKYKNHSGRTEEKVVKTRGDEWGRDVSGNDSGSYFPAILRKIFEICRFACD